MGLINFLGTKPPAAPQVASASPVAKPETAATPAASVQVAAADTFEASTGSPIVSLDGGAGDASFPDWASLGSGGGGKVGSIGD